jgi:hypothetical protein
MLRRAHYLKNKQDIDNMYAERYLFKGFHGRRAHTAPEAAIKNSKY